MTLDVRGSLKNTSISANQYAVFEELISNAIDSFLIRNHETAILPSMRVEIEVDFLVDLLNDVEGMAITCKDNGCGLGDEQLNAFLTRDTSYKDDLPIPGIGQCKGSGRLQFFHYFSALTIDSTYFDGSATLRRQMSYSEPQKQIDSDDFKSSPGSEEQIGTVVRLERIRENARSRMPRGQSLYGLFSAPVLKKQMLVTFLQRLVSLESRLGDFEVKFVTRSSEITEQVSILSPSDIPAVTTEKVVNIEECDPESGKALGTSECFKISHYRLDATNYDLPCNAIAFCAKSSPVKDVTPRYLRTRTEQNNPIGGFHHIVLIESGFLDQRVNEQRDGFDRIPEDIPSGDIFSTEKVSYSSIYEAIDPVIVEMVRPAAWKKENILKEITNQFGVSEAMLVDTSTRIVYGEPSKSVVERVLKKYQERVIDETVEIYSLKEEILNATPDSEAFREKINEISWKYTSSLRNIDMANLSQLIVRRAAIVEILDLACNKNLATQSILDGVRRKDERIIHSIFFPMRKDSNDVTDHDIWLLSEEYQYYDYIASDTPLSSIKWSSTENVFESDIDTSFQELLARRADDNGGKRPDIALFSKEGSAIIVEFKAPGVQMDEHIGDLTEYAHLLAAKSGGKLRKFYGYLIGDSVNALRLGSAWTPFPTGGGWFQSGPLQDPGTRQQLGETYFEILHFNDVITKARKRIGVYKNKLDLDLGV